MRIVSVFCACTCLAACSRNPASEAPVQLRPGMYQVNIGGGTIIGLNGGGPSRAICLDSYWIAKLPDDPLQLLAGSWGDCSAQIERRKGNAIGGARTCDERRMPIRVTYRGSVTPVSFLIHGTVTQGSDESEERMHLGSGDFTIAGKRLGNCSL